MKPVPPAEAWKAVQEGRAQLLDVREPSEHAAESIAGALLIPLGSLEGRVGELKRGLPVLVLCARGVRAARAAEQLAALGIAQAAPVAGGMAAWKEAGLPWVKGPSRVWAMDRQVRFAAGALVLIGVLGGWLWHPGLYALAGFVGAGLAYSGASDTCAMAALLSLMPWNRGEKTSC